jgi:signal transduction histidine kinase
MLLVKDNGCGIAEEDLPRIFYPFFSTKSGGSGLGLAIASNLIAAHGGKIEVESKNGQGTAFKIFLPVNHKNTGDKNGENTSA